MRFGSCECRGCTQDGVGFNDDGTFMCEDCLFEWVEEQNNPDLTEEEAELCGIPLW